jgi:hypothetical protein
VIAVNVVGRHNINVVGAEDGPTIMLVHGFGHRLNVTLGRRRALSDRR